MIPGQTGVPDANLGAPGAHGSLAVGGIHRLDYDEFSLDYVGTGTMESNFLPDDLAD